MSSVTKMTILKFVIKALVSLLLLEKHKSTSRLKVDFYKSYLTLKNTHETTTWSSPVIVLSQSVRNVFGLLIRSSDLHIFILFNVLAYRIVLMTFFAYIGTGCCAIVQLPVTIQHIID